MRHTKDIPHVRVVVGACLIAIIGYAIFSFYVVVVLKDATMIGDTVGTWKSFAILAFGFWIGSSSGGKVQTDTQDVKIVNQDNDAVPVKSEDI